MVEEKISEEVVYVAKDNRKYKDSVFTDLFSGDLTAKENQVSLYNALHGTEYSADTIEIGKIALESILYMNFRNDVSLQMQEKCLLFAEHQSTINENMCVRFLMYKSIQFLKNVRY